MSKIFALIYLGAVQLCSSNGRAAIAFYRQFNSIQDNSLSRQFQLVQFASSVRRRIAESEDYDPTPTPTPEISKMPTPTPTPDFDSDSLVWAKYLS